MRHAALILPCFLYLACAKSPQVPAEEQAKHSDDEVRAKPGDASVGAESEQALNWKPKVTKPKVIRQDLVANDLPAIPTLAAGSAEVTRSGTFALPDESDRLAPRAVVELGETLAFVGQAYLEHESGTVKQSWQWIGIADEGRKLGTGAIRGACPDGAGGALLAGTLNARDEARGWVGRLDAKGELTLDLALESKTLTEMLAILPGRAEGEMAVALGYMDAQGWVVSLDAKGAQRWQKFVSSYGYTQIRAALRLDRAPGNILAVGTRAQGFGESWWARLPGDGGPDASSEGIAQDKLSCEGSDEHQMLRALVDVGDAGYIALGTAMRNHIQAHQQVIAAGFDREGELLWSRVLPELRVTQVSGSSSSSPGTASFVVEVPLDDDGERSALAWLELGAGAEGKVEARMLEGSEGWHSAGLVGGSAQPQIAAYRDLEAAMKWQLLAAPDPA